MHFCFLDLKKSHDGHVTFSHYVISYLDLNCPKFCKNKWLTMSHFSWCFWPETRWINSPKCVLFACWDSVFWPKIWHAFKILKMFSRGSKTHFRRFTKLLNEKLESKSIGISQNFYQGSVDIQDFNFIVRYLVHLQKYFRTFQSWNIFDFKFTSCYGDFSQTSKIRLCLLWYGSDLRIPVI